MRTPLSYWGGKQQLAKTIVQRMPHHRIYDEPFFGGGAVFFAKSPSSAEFINDTNKEIVNFFRCLQGRRDDLIGAIKATLYSEEEHRHARFVLDNADEYSEIQRAAAVFITCRQSIYRVMDNGWDYRLDGGNPKGYRKVVDEVLAVCADRLRDAYITCRDAIRLIEGVDSPDTFHYCDPPYYNSDCGHYSGYSEEDFQQLLDTLAKVKGKFLLSSYPSEVLSRYVKEYGWHCESIDMRKSAGGKPGAQKTEVLTRNYQIDDQKQLMLF